MTEAEHRAKANRENVALLMSGGLSRDEANVIVDMTEHFERQLDELTIRTITTLVSGTSGAAALAGTIVLGITLKRRGHTVRDSVLELLDGKL